MVDRACQAFHLSRILPTLSCGAQLTILVFGFHDGVLGSSGHHVHINEDYPTIEIMFILMRIIHT